MMKSSIVKISRPGNRGAYPRERLFDLLDGPGNQPLVWISAPAGFGKTTLVTSWLESRKLPCLWYNVDRGDSDVGSVFYYLGLAVEQSGTKNKNPLPLLSPEYLQEMGIFARRYFEDMFTRLEPPHVLVFDDYQEIGTKPEINNIICEGVAVTPPGMKTVIISRSDPPPSFSRYLANGSLIFITRDHMRLTLDESLAIMKTGEKKIGKKTGELLYKRTQGWAAGLILITESRIKTGKDEREWDRLELHEIFDYFTSEIFEKTEPGVRELLMQTSFLTHFTPETVKELTGNPRSDEILLKLYRENSFISMDQKERSEYRYHPLFRNFLMARAEKKYEENELSDILRRSATLMLESDNIEDAAILLINGEEWEELAGLCLNNAHSLISQGRALTLGSWLEKIPDPILSGSGMLLYWLGVSRMTVDPAESRLLFEKASRLSEETSDITGTLLSASTAIDAIIIEWGDFTHLDRWIELLNSYLGPNSEDLPSEIQSRVTLSMAFALMIRRPQSTGLEDLISRAIYLSRDQGDINLRIQAYICAIIYYFWTGDQGKGRLLLEEIEDLANAPGAIPLLKLTWFWARSAKQMWDPASPWSELKENITRALEYAEETGVHIWDHMFYGIAAYASIANGEMEEADGFLNNMKQIVDGKRLHIESQYHYINAFNYYLQRASTMALAHAEASLKIAVETGFIFPQIHCQFLMVQILNQQEKREEALKYVEMGIKMSIETKSPIFHFMFLLSRARIDFSRGDEESGFSHLSEAFALGRERDYYNLLWWYDSGEMSELCEKGVEADMEPDYLRKLISVHRLWPKGEKASEKWPWPIKIHTLGRFEIVIEGETLKSTGKVQQKPLALLKVLIALGGKEVPEEPVADTLWPDAEGDSAHKSFEMNLIRLRKLLGDKESLKLSGSRVTLNPRFCRVDTWDLENAITNSENAWISWSRGEVEGTEAVELTDRVNSFYTPPFLPGDESYPWVLSFRERLTRRVLNLQVQCAGYYQSGKEWDKALIYLEKALMLDDLSEEIYQRIMISHLKNGNPSEAMRAYRRCRERLSAVLEINPSEKTEEIVHHLLKSSGS